MEILGKEGLRGLICRCGCVCGMVGWGWRDEMGVFDGSTVCKAPHKNDN
jgi:hypothetical protein